MSQVFEVLFHCELVNKININIKYDNIRLSKNIGNKYYNKF